MDDIVYCYRYTDALGITHRLRTERFEYTRTYYGDEYILEFHHYQMCDESMVHETRVTRGDLPTCLLCYLVPVGGS